MKPSKNNITGDSLVSKPNTDNYRDNYDAIFRKGRVTDIVEDFAEYKLGNCSICGIRFEPMMGYSCSRVNCPHGSKVTC